MKKAIAIGLICFSIFLIGCNASKLSSAEFTNTTPAVIKMDDFTYSMTDEALSTHEVEEQIGEITKIQVMVSYAEDQDPYKSPGKVFKVKAINIEESIAIQANDKLYKADLTKNSIIE